MPLVHNKTSGVVHLGEDATLMPGVNTVKEAHWNKWKDHPIVQTNLENDLYAVMSASGLADMDVSESVRTVKATADEKLLTNWQKDDKRKPVLEAIRDQLAKLRLEGTGSKKE